MEEKDLKQLQAKGISQEKFEQQLSEFKTGFPFLKLEGSATIGAGIVAPTAEEVKQYVKVWNDYKAEGKKIVKFVPASGAASRMFKDMFAFVDADYDVPTTDFEKKYFDNIEKFAFYDALDALLSHRRARGSRNSLPRATTSLLPRACSLRTVSTTVSYLRVCCCSTAIQKAPALQWRSISWRERSMRHLMERQTYTSPYLMSTSTISRLR